MRWVKWWLSFSIKTNHEDSYYSILSEGTFIANKLQNMKMAKEIVQHTEIVTLENYNYTKGQSRKEANIITVVEPLCVPTIPVTQISSPSGQTVIWETTKCIITLLALPHSEDRENSTNVCRFQSSTEDDCYLHFPGNVYFYKWVMAPHSSLPSLREVFL